MECTDHWSDWSNSCTEHLSQYATMTQPFVTVEWMNKHNSDASTNPGDYAYASTNDGPTCNTAVNASFIAWLEARQPSAVRVLQWSVGALRQVRLQCAELATTPTSERGACPDIDPAHRVPTHTVAVVVVVTTPTYCFHWSLERTSLDRRREREIPGMTATTSMLAKDRETAERDLRGAQGAFVWDYPGEPVPER